jgi:excisionase family DNA binding protein
MQNNEKLFATIGETARLTGLSRFYIRKGVRAGEIQHITSGTKYLVNLPALFEHLGLPWPSVMAESTPGQHGNGRVIR